jgi:hypothetical protein
VDQLASFYLPAALKEHTYARTKESTDFLDNFFKTNVYVTIIGILALFFFFFVVYEPFLRSIDLQIKETRFLLLLFPEELARQLPEVIAAARKLLNGSS